MTVLAFAYLGGITCVSGAVTSGVVAASGVAFYGLAQVTGRVGQWETLVGGVLLIATAVANPEGIAGTFRARRAAAPPARGRRRNRRSVAGDDLPLLDARGVTVSYGGLHANDGIDIACAAGSLVGLIGPNGAGKTTFIDALSGFVPLAQGRVTFDGRRPRRRRALTHGPRSASLAPSSRSSCSRTSPFATTCWQQRSGLGRYSFLADLVVPADTRRQYLDQVDWALDRMGLESVAETMPNALSNGQRKLVSVARALAARPQLVLLDEPAAGLDTAESQTLGRRLRRAGRRRTTLLLVDHDMGLVLDVCDEIYVLDFGQIIAHGSPAEVRARPGGDRGVPRRHRAPRGPGMNGDPAGEAVVDVRGLHAGYGGVAVVRDLDLIVARGEVVALLGPNGAGKTTTLLTLSGLLAPIAGSVSVLGESSRRFQAAPRGAARTGPRAGGSLAVLRPHGRREHPPRCDR